jgi:hypothetical protein
VSDYNGLSENPPLNRSGTPVPGYSGWKRTASVAWADPSSPSAAAGSDMGLKQITVRVTSPRGRDFALVGLRCSSDTYERQAQAATTYASWVDITIEAGTGGTAKVTSGVNLLNQVP